MINRDKEAFITAFSGTQWEAEMVKTLLQDAGIQSFFQNSTGNSYSFEPIFSQSVKVFISESDAIAATEVIEKYYQNMQKS